VRRTVAIVAGARPNFMKIAPVLRAIEKMKPGFDALLVHTGQHYSPELSDVFFAQLGIRKPDAHLEAGSGTHGQQTAKVLEAFEAFLLKSSPRPDAVMVVGDVNSTIAAALAAAKLGIRVVHLEAGLRSFDRAMPEEINRLATDAISDLLLVSEPEGEVNLRREGVPPERVRYVGNVMIDTLAHHLEAARARPARVPVDYALVTLHRPSNVDARESLTAVAEFLASIAARIRVVFPVHPRTRARLEEFGLFAGLEAAGVVILGPQGYIENLGLMAGARMVLTDSGGIQEETSYLGLPCLTLRENTERPSTVTHGTNTLVGRDFALVLQNQLGNSGLGRARRRAGGRGTGMFYRRIIKPLSDRLLAAVGLIALSPALLILALLIRLKMGSPVVFRQVRIGRNDREFGFRKFRTMTDARDASGALLPDGERLTSLGRFLRATSLDEFPQLWNVVRGDMSLIGPRPLLPEYLPRYLPRQRRRHEVRPGITGLAQVNGRNALSWEEKFAFDVRYVDEYSFAMDARILWLTVIAIVRREGISKAGHATAPVFMGSERK
jgi:UDP-N-acetylglucosamine 2-epimerase (non-hydrolysing)